MLNKIMDIIDRGLWPFTPDPVPAGVYEFGTPLKDTPALITSNSRHTLAQLRQILSPIGGRVLAIDTGGVDVHSALASGGWSIEKITVALETIEQGKSASSSIEPGSHKDVEPLDPVTVVLPYPIWEFLVSDNSKEIKSYRLLPGPANARDLPAFFSRGCQLVEEMKVLSFTLHDRLSLCLAQAGIFCLVVTLPLFVLGWQELVVGMAIAVISALLFAIFWPLLPGKHFLLKRAPLFLGLPVLSASIGWAMGISPLVLLYLGLATLVVTGWSTINIDLQ